MTSASFIFWLIALLFAYIALLFVPIAAFQPFGQLFNLILLWFGGWIFGWLCTRYARLPALGSLLFGMILANLIPSSPNSSTAGLVDPLLSSSIRLWCFALIMIRAGLGLGTLRTILKTYPFLLPALAFLPCTIESVFHALSFHFIPQIGLTWTYAWTLGWALSAISPAIVVPLVLELGERGYGSEKGVKGLVLAGCAMDDILCVTVFTILTGFLIPSSTSRSTTTSVVLLQVFRPVIEISLGMGLSLLTSLFALISSHPLQFSAIQHTLFLMSISCAYVYAARWVGYQAAGIIGVLGGSLTYRYPPLFLIQFVKRVRQWVNGVFNCHHVDEINVDAASQETMGDLEMDQDVVVIDENQMKSMAGWMQWMWQYIGEPLQFSLVGATIRFTSSSNSGGGSSLVEPLTPIMYGYSTLLILTGTVVRCAVVFGVMAWLTPSTTTRVSTRGNPSRVTWTVYERCFMIVCWIPKATVQAAVATIPLDLILTTLSSRGTTGDEVDWKWEMRQAQWILVSCVMSILITSPIGAGLIHTTGPRWLKLDQQQPLEDVINNVDVSEEDAVILEKIHVLKDDGNQ